jgi:hypothetical protein
VPASAERAIRYRDFALEWVQRFKDRDRGARFFSRALHGVASTYERMPDHLTDARTAWMEYTHFADGAARVAPGTIGRERVSTIDVAGEQERVYVDVRARIADRQRIAREAAAAPPPPPPPSRGRR